jgi:hypothetical protein
MLIKVKKLKSLIRESLLSEDFMRGAIVRSAEPITLFQQNSNQRKTFEPSAVFTYLGTDGVFHQIKASDGLVYNITKKQLMQSFGSAVPARKPVPSNLRGKTAL